MSSRLDRFVQPVRPQDVTRPDRQCQAQCHEPPHYLHTHRCSRDATQWNGMSLCTQHFQMSTRRPHLLAQWLKGSR